MGYGSLPLLYLRYLRISRIHRILKSIMVALQETINVPLAVTKEGTIRINA